MTTTFKSIAKEDIAHLVFSSNDVLTDPQEIFQRKQDLEKAMAMGNTDQVKIEIFFEDDKEQLVTNTTVWAVTPEHLVLKKGVTIPVNRIYRII
ncbi:hypothetical protein MG290_07410 [Flavobacterium sp. CBA20B-1]|uniref:hypothetical protein n=1 Tax=unclassified Flavobacterium TaxID=196869 RepID=UPI00222473F7|nr:MULTISPECIES: hypothetical protein [unclassified Flavobacterium]WCM40805.1 hypothetical protein MG290_07410 [Flavobacterium sp. CBA20B-1]